MPTLDVTDDFDVHDYRHGLKLIKQDAETLTFANREAFECPACEQPFERLLVSEARTLSFDGSDGGPFCVVRAGEKLLVLSH